MICEHYKQRHQKQLLLDLLHECLRFVDEQHPGSTGATSPFKMSCLWQFLQELRCQQKMCDERFGAQDSFGELESNEQVLKKPRKAFQLALQEHGEVASVSMLQG
jgi:hypothetical protein